MPVFYIIAYTRYNPLRGQSPGASARGGASSSPFLTTKKGGLRFAHILTLVLRPRYEVPSAHGAYDGEIPCVPKAKWVPLFHQGPVAGPLRTCLSASEAPVCKYVF